MKKINAIVIAFCFIFMFATDCLAASHENIVTISMIDFGITDYRFYVKEVIDGPGGKVEYRFRSGWFFQPQKAFFLIRRFEQQYEILDGQKLSSFKIQNPNPHCIKD